MPHVSDRHNIEQCHVTIWRVTETFCDLRFVVPACTTLYAYMSTVLAQVTATSGLLSGLLSQQQLRVAVLSIVTQELPKLVMLLLLLISNSNKGLRQALCDV
jgi:hypothetical protein